MDTRSCSTVCTSCHHVSYCNRLSNDDNFSCASCCPEGLVICVGCEVLTVIRLLSRRPSNMCWMQSPHCDQTFKTIRGAPLDLCVEYMYVLVFPLLQLVCKLGGRAL